jgi:hypothetical protein
MTDRDNINITLECIICFNKANFDFHCKHHLCKNCYKVEKFCLICNSNVKITPIFHPNYTSHTSHTYVTNISPFVLSYNVLRVMSGLGSFQYTS